MSLFSILLKFNFLRYPGVTLQQIFSGAEKAGTTQHRAVTAALEINIYNFTLEQKKLGFGSMNVGLSNIHKKGI